MTITLELVLSTPCTKAELIRNKMPWAQMNEGEVHTAQTQCSRAPPTPIQALACTPRMPTRMPTLHLHTKRPNYNHPHQHKAGRQKPDETPTTKPRA